MTSPPTHADLVIAGGGILGLSLAWQAALRGLSVVVLEQGRIGQGTSSATFAWVNASSKTGDRAYHDLNAGGVARYHALAAEHGPGTIGLGGRGSLQFIECARRDLHRQLKADHATLRQFGDAVDWLDAAAIRRALPGLTVADDTEGLLASADRWLEVQTFLRWLTAQIAAQGGVVLEQTGLQSVERDAGGGIAAVMTSRGRIATPRLTIAAGIDTPALVALASDGRVRAFPLRAVPGFLLESGPAPLAQQLDLVLWSPDPRGIHVRQTAAGGLLLGADDLDALVGEGNDPVAVTEARRIIWQRAGQWFPTLDTAALDAAASWRIGRRPMPADGKSIVGALAAVPGLSVVATHSGVTLAPTLAELLAAELSGAAPQDALAPFRPARFGL